MPSDIYSNNKLKCSFFGTGTMKLFFASLDFAPLDNASLGQIFFRKYRNFFEKLLLIIVNKVKILTF
jgi:hypothetical protein